VKWKKRARYAAEEMGWTAEPRGSGEGGARRIAKKLDIFNYSMPKATPSRRKLFIRFLSFGQS
jgi:hypothetical protein